MFVCFSHHIILHHDGTRQDVSRITLLLNSATLNHLASLRRTEFYDSRITLFASTALVRMSLASHHLIRKRTFFRRSSHHIILFGIGYFFAGKSMLVFLYGLQLRSSHHIQHYTPLAPIVNLIFGIKTQIYLLQVQNPQQFGHAYGGGMGLEHYHTFFPIPDQPHLQSVESFSVKPTEFQSLLCCNYTPDWSIFT